MHMHIRISVCTRAHTHTHIFTHKYTHIHPYTYSHTFTYILTYTLTHRLNVYYIGFHKNSRRTYFNLIERK